MFVFSINFVQMPLEQHLRHACKAGIAWSKSPHRLWPTKCVGGPTWSASIILDSDECFLSTPASLNEREWSPNYTLLAPSLRFREMRIELAKPVPGNLWYSPLVCIWARLAQIRAQSQGSKGNQTRQGGEDRLQFKHFPLRYTHTLPTFASIPSMLCAEIRMQGQKKEE